ncbi:MAG TPA: hypothetical protein VE441_13250 [Mycobacterium sp.]|nr:hypothetical protein [Mycobacterium sp.]
MKSVGVLVAAVLIASGCSTSGSGSGGSDDPAASLLASDAGSSDVATRHTGAERVHVALIELAGDFRGHLAITEGPDGLHDELLATAPRLHGAATRMVREHSVIKDQIEDLIARACTPDITADVDQVREHATALLARLARHGQRGSDLIFEAYETDIGGET